MADFNGRVREIFETGQNYVVLAIPRADGTVQSVVVWANVIGDEIAVNSNESRAWPKNLRRAGTATITAFADNDPYTWVSVTGPVNVDTHDGAVEHINELAQKYTGKDYANFQPGEQRVKFTITPERIVFKG